MILLTFASILIGSKPLGLTEIMALVSGSGSEEVRTLVGEVERLGADQYAREREQNHQDGLVHVSAMSNKFISDTKELFRYGQVEIDNLI